MRKSVHVHVQLYVILFVRKEADVRANFCSCQNSKIWDLKLIIIQLLKSISNSVKRKEKKESVSNGVAVERETLGPM